MRVFFACLGMVAVAQAQAADLVPSATVTPAATVTSTVTLTVKVNVPELLTATYTCATPDPSGDGSCDIPPNAPVGTPVYSFKITGMPSAYTGTPTFTESTNSLKLSGNNVVTAVSPLTVPSISPTIAGSQ